MAEEEVGIVAVPVIAVAVDSEEEGGTLEEAERTSFHPIAEEEVVGVVHLDIVVVAAVSAAAVPAVAIFFPCCDLH